MKISLIIFTSLITFFAKISIAGKEITTKVYSMTNDRDNNPIATDENGRKGVDGALQGLAVGATSKALNGSTSIGDSSSSDGKFGLALGTKSTVTQEANESVALGYQSIANEKNTISIGNENFKRRLVNVKDGNIDIKSTDAINGSQLFVTKKDVIKNNNSISENKVNINNLNKMIHQSNTDGNITIAAEKNGDSVSVNGTEGQRFIRGVKAGISDNDAVNLSQLNELQKYNNQVFQNLDKRIRKIDNKLSAGIASSMAMAGIPQAYLPDASLVGMAISSYADKSVLLQ